MNRIILILISLVFPGAQQTGPICYFVRKALGASSHPQAMSWPDVMEDINYEDKNFKLDEVSLRHPLWMTEGHYIYHLLRDTHGHLSCRTDNNGEPICSPR